MKVRQGFVSNSSSTSFYVPESLKQRAEEIGFTLVSVKDIIKALKTLEPVDFLMGWRGHLEALEKMGDGYITAPYDRDWAYQMGYDVEFGAFATDL